jgi:S-adenosylmethionine hydrolase
LHVIVVDPGVGTERALLHVTAGDQQLLVPDNGCWTEYARSAGSLVVRRLSERRFWRPEVSATFHGRDILAPVAGHLSLGLDAALLGPVLTTWVQLPLPSARRTVSGWEGEVVFVDDFGNLITNVPADSIGPRWAWVEIAGQRLDRQVRSYGDAGAGTLVTLASSVATLEIAVVQGNAAERLGVKAGTPVRTSEVA